MRWLLKDFHAPDQKLMFFGSFPRTRLKSWAENSSNNTSKDTGGDENLGKDESGEWKGERGKIPSTTSSSSSVSRSHRVLGGCLLSRSTRSPTATPFIAGAEKDLSPPPRPLPLPRPLVPFPLPFITVLASPPPQAAAPTGSPDIGRRRRTSAQRKTARAPSCGVLPGPGEMWGGGRRAEGSRRWRNVLWFISLPPAPLFILAGPDGVRAGGGFCGRDHRGAAGASRPSARRGGGDPCRRWGGTGGPPKRALPFPLRFSNFELNGGEPGGWRETDRVPACAAPRFPIPTPPWHAIAMDGCATNRTP